MTNISVPIGQDGQRDEFQIHPVRYSALAPEFILQNQHSTFVARVDAEDFYRAVCAAWELVKPLGVEKSTQ